MAAMKKKTEADAPLSRIPHFANIREAAEFWDTHDSTDFEDEFEDVDDLKIGAVIRTSSLNVTLGERAIADLTARAREQKIRPSTLARRLLLEALKRDSKAS
jgi:hypothetical protein